FAWRYFLPRNRWNSAPAALIAFAMVSYASHGSPVPILVLLSATRMPCSTLIRSAGSTSGRGGSDAVACITGVGQCFAAISIYRKIENSISKIEGAIPKDRGPIPKDIGRSGSPFVFGSRSDREGSEASVTHQMNLFDIRRFVCCARDDSDGG